MHHPSDVRWALGYVLVRMAETGSGASLTCHERLRLGIRVLCIVDNPEANAVDSFTSVTEHHLTLILYTLRLRVLCMRRDAFCPCRGYCHRR